MDDTLLFIPPCCADKKLPKAVMQTPHYSLTFYTHGDVTMEKFYRAISYMVVDRHVLVIAMPTVSNETAAFLQQCFERKWITDLVISSATIRLDLAVERYLSDYRDHVMYITDKKVTEHSSHMTLYSGTQALMLTGPMLACASLNTRLMAYTCSSVLRSRSIRTQTTGATLCATRYCLTCSGCVQRTLRTSTAYRQRTCATSF